MNKHYWVSAVVEYFQLQLDYNRIYSNCQHPN
nr:MAG TPA: hypothetical protein [Caudoviricetes sp.]